MVGGGLLDYIVSPSPIPFPLDFGPGFLDLDLGLDLGLTISEPDIRYRHTPVEK